MKMIYDPPPLHHLVGALHEMVHKDIGISRPVFCSKNRATMLVGLGCSRADGITDPYIGLILSMDTHGYFGEWTERMGEINEV
jgi:hypothetical protein